MVVEQLVVNGCSYMELYTQGSGHHDLAQRLGLQHSVGMALGGSCNARIIRSTLKHSYQTQRPSLYVLGLTFLHRWEITVAQPVEIVPGDPPPGELPWEVPGEGRWVNPQSTHGYQRVLGWTDDDTRAWADLMFKSYVDSEFDYLEDLVYRVVALRADLYRRGHRLLCFNTVNRLDNVTATEFDQLSPMIHEPYIMHGFQWQSNTWQRQQGAAWHEYDPGRPVPPDHSRHIAAGQHEYLNGYLVDYIGQHGILL